MVVVSFHQWVNPPARTVSCKGWNKRDIGTFKHLMEHSFHTIPSLNIDEYLHSLGTTMIEVAKLMNHEKRPSFKYLPTCSPWNKRIGRLARLAYRNPKIFFRMAKADDLMPKFSMTSVTPHHVNASLMQVNNPWNPEVINDVPQVETMQPKMPENAAIKHAMNCGRGKSAGMDEVPSFLWYILQDDIFKHVCDIIRVVLKESYYPEVFKATRVFPLLKKGDPLEAKSWRPISITNALYRLVFKLMYQQLYEHLEPNCILSNLEHKGPGHVHKRPLLWKA